MTDTGARNKVQVIYNLMGNIPTGSIYYCHDGTLHFNYKSSTYLNYKITPVEDKYKIKVYTPINIATTVVLYEIDGVDGNELYDTFHNIVEYLDKEWGKWNKDSWKGTWYGYPKGKEIKYDDHGFIVSAS